MKKKRVISLVEDKPRKAANIEGERGGSLGVNGLNHPIFVNQFKKIIKKGLNRCQNMNQLVYIAQQLQPKLQLCVESNEPYQIIAQYLLQELQGIKKSKDMKDKMNLTIINFFRSLSIPFPSELKVDLNKALQKTLDRYEWFKIIPNLWDSETNTYKCYCGKEKGTTQQQCYRCKRKAHVDCFWAMDSSQKLFECAACYLIHCLPHRPIDTVLFLGCMEGDYKDNTKFKASFMKNQTVEFGKTFEVRCARLNEKNRFQITFPNQCTVIAHEKKVAQFEPLVENTSLKRRNDQVVVVEKSHLRQLNAIYIDQTLTAAEKNQEPVNHLLMLVLTRPCVIVDILRQRFLIHKTRQQEAIRFLKQYMGSEVQECKIERLRISLVCQFYSTLIKHPARSVHCTHYQPFDLTSLIHCSSKGSMNVRSWKCPICKKRAYDLRLDEYLLKLIEAHQNLEEVVFDLRGKPVQLKKQGSGNCDSQDESVNKLSVKTDKTNPIIDQLKKKIKQQIKPVKEDTIINLDDEDVCIVQKEAANMVPQSLQKEYSNEIGYNLSVLLKRSLLQTAQDRQQQKQQKKHLFDDSNNTIHSKQIVDQLRNKLQCLMNRPQNQTVSKSPTK